MPTFPPLPDWVQLEHQVAHILQKQEEHGWYFDERAAYELESALRGELEEATEILRRKFGFVAGTVFTPKRNNRTQGYVQGCPFTKLKQLNPTSRDHIVWILQTHENWKPTQRTATGKAGRRRDSIERYWVGDSPLVSEMSRYYQKLGMISEA